MLQLAFFSNLVSFSSSLVSFSSKGLVGLVGGFCIGAQVTASLVLASLYFPQQTVSLTATRTTKIVLAPTASVLSNSSITFPGVAAAGYILFIFLSVFAIFRAKGFNPQINLPASGHPVSPPDADPGVFADNTDSSKKRRAIPTLFVAGGQPPPPPPLPGPASKQGPRSQWKWFFWLFLALFIVIGIGAFVCTSIARHRNVVQPEIPLTDWECVAHDYNVVVQALKRHANELLTRARAWILVRARRSFHFTLVVFSCCHVYAFTSIVFLALARSVPVLRWLFKWLFHPGVDRHDNSAIYYNRARFCLVVLLPVLLVSVVALELFLLRWHRDLILILYWNESVEMPLLAGIEHTVWPIYNDVANELIPELRRLGRAYWDFFTPTERRVRLLSWWLSISLTISRRCSRSLVRFLSFRGSLRTSRPRSVFVDKLISLCFFHKSAPNSDPVVLRQYTHFSIPIISASLFDSLAVR
ncbi:hypothetical protein FB451DRAFT_786989 [Mycena latifolia]|nr:hypothetical protein FB451DRAFT_786989 [Mycena latifolia]